MFGVGLYLSSLIINITALLTCDVVFLPSEMGRDVTGEGSPVSDNAVHR